MKAINICALAAVALPMAFISCSDDDDNNSSSSGSPSENVSIITTTDGNKLLLSSINNSSVRFQYDDSGRCTNIDMWEYYFFSMSYDPFKVDVTNDDDDTMSCSLSFNSSGYISKAVYSESYDDGDESASQSATLTLSYNSSGQLTSATNDYSGKEKYYSDSYSYSGTSTLTITWDGDNINRMEVAQRETLGGYTYSYSATYTYTYGDMENKYRQYTMQFDEDATECLDLISEFCLIGYLGAGSAYLPTSCTREYEENDFGDTNSGTSTDNLTYTLNNDGTISTEKFANETYRYYYVDLDSNTRSAAPEPFADELSVSDKPSKRIHGLHNRLYSKHARAEK